MHRENKQTFGMSSLAIHSQVKSFCILFLHIFCFAAVNKKKNIAV